MKNLHYYRAPRPEKKAADKKPLRRPQRGRSGAPSLIRPFAILLTAFTIFLYASYAAHTAYTKIKNSDFKNTLTAKEWKLKGIEVGGVAPETAEHMVKALNLSEGAEIKDSELPVLTARLSSSFPQLKNITLTKGRISKKLYVKAKVKEPVMLLRTAAGEVMLDKEGEFFKSAQDKPVGIPVLDVSGLNVEKVSPAMMKTLFKINDAKKAIPFEGAHFYADGSKLVFELGGGNELNIGSHTDLDEKIKAASNVLKYIKINKGESYTLNMEYYNQGKAYAQRRLKTDLNI
ncbi:hypothetical protein Dip518_001385 [Parelusimicrobium proximum]|uniref:cell division protein FtsQ/DivIB n=1 Tax=Parelusimicrobium proximum TaxID=3228953 RepID=UPI003D17F61A